MSRSNNRLTKLSEVGEWGTGGTPKRSVKDYYGGGIPWLKVSDLNDGKVVQSEETISEAGLRDSSAKMVSEGTVLVALYGASIGKLGVAGIPCCTNQAIAFCKPHDGFDRDFLFWRLRSLRKQLNDMARGGAQPNISQSLLKGLEVFMPDFSAQKKIACAISDRMSKLDAIEALRCEAGVEKAYLRESLVEAQLQGIRGEPAALADVCSIESHLVDPKKPEFSEMIHVGGANIESKTGRLIDLRTAKEEGLTSSKFVFDGTAVLYNKIRPYLVKIARPDFSGLCSADMYPLVPNLERITRSFLYYLLISRSFTNYAIDGSNRAGMPKVNRSHLFAFRFKLPSIREQERICRTLDMAFHTVDSLNSQVSEVKREVAELRESILQESFAGER